MKKLRLMRTRSCRTIPVFVLLLATLSTSLFAQGDPEKSREQILAELESLCNKNPAYEVFDCDKVMSGYDAVSDSLLNADMAEGRKWYDEECKTGETFTTRLEGAMPCSSLDAFMAEQASALGPVDASRYMMAIANDTTYFSRTAISAMFSGQCEGYLRMNPNLDCDCFVGRATNEFIGRGGGGSATRQAASTTALQTCM